MKRLYLNHYFVCARCARSKRVCNARASTHECTRATDKRAANGCAHASTTCGNFSADSTTSITHCRRSKNCFNVV